MTDMVV